MKHFTLIALALGLLFFASCDKANETTTPAPTTPTPTTPAPTTPTPKTKKELLVDGKWQWVGLEFVTTVNGQDSLVDGWSVVEDCVKDNIMTYSADGKGTIDEMATKCDPADPQTKTLTWELMNNDTEVKVTDDEGTHVITIMELTATKAVLRQTTTSGGSPIVVQQTFKNIK